MAKDLKTYRAKCRVLLRDADMYVKARNAAEAMRKVAAGEFDDIDWTRAELANVEPTGLPEETTK